MSRIQPPDWRAIVRERLTRETLRPESLEDCVEELAQHLEAEYQELRARGCSPEDARARLLSALDAPELLDSVTKRSHPNPLPAVGAPPGRRRVPELVSLDVRYAFRSLRRSPVLTAVIVVSLGVVIGANAAIFGLIESLMLRRLDVPRAEELVAMHASHQGEWRPFEYRQLQAVRAMPGMEDLQGFRIEPATVTSGADSVDLFIDMVSGGLVDLIGVPPLMGRALTPQDEATATPVLVVSEEFWRTRLRSDPNVIGRRMQVGLFDATIVGVMPASFTGIHFARQFNVMMPISLSPGGLRDPGAAQVTMLWRRSESADRLAALDGIIARCCIDPKRLGFEPPATIQDRRRRPEPEESRPRGVLSSATTDSSASIAIIDASRGLPWDTDYRGRYGKMLFAIAAGGAILLVIACINVATLQVSRAVARRRDFAIRLAMGASRTRVAMQLFSESLLLAATGATLGLFVAQAANRLLLHYLPPVASRLSGAISWSPNAMVLLFTTAIVVLCTLLVGIWPARSAARADVAVPLAGGALRPASSRWPVGAALVTAQVACTIVLVVLGGLFATTVRQLTHTAGGYGTRDVIIARVMTDFNDTTTLLPRYRDMLDQVAALPGVRGAAFSTSSPVFQDQVGWIPFTADGTKPGRGSGTRANIVSSGYFTATGIGMREGRDFTTVDDARGEQVVIVSASFARRRFPQGALGATVGLGRGTARIVGIANDARYDKLQREPSLRIVDEEMLYLPIEQSIVMKPWFKGLTLIVRTEDDAVTSIPSVRARLTRVAPDLRVPLFTTVGQLLDNLTVGERFLAGLMNAFAFLALLLASAGVFGIMSYQVTQRTREIGVRMALGARPVDAVWLVLRRALLVAGIGALVGTALALGAAHAVRAQLYGVSATDPRALIFAAVLLILVAIAAALLPGRRAASVDPLTALRAE